MKRIKGLKVLKSALEELNVDVIYSICIELRRIGRPMDLEKIGTSVFNFDLPVFLKALSPQGDAEILIDTKDDQTELESEIKRFKELVIENYLATEKLIEFLAFLKEFKGPHGEKASILMPLDELMAFEGDDPDNWICQCGNHSGADGFYPCDADGNLIEAVESSGWEGLCRCERCGRVLHQDTRQVIGRNLNPNREEVQDEN